MKKSNVLLLSSYLTILFSFIAFLLAARSYIQEYFPNGYVNGLVEGSYSIDTPVHHLLVEGQYLLLDVEVGNQTAITCIHSPVQDKSDVFKVNGDTLSILRNTNLQGLILSSQLESIRTTAGETIRTGIMGDRSVVYFTNEDWFETSNIALEAGNKNKLEVFASNTNLHLYSYNRNENTSLDTLIIYLMNASLSIDPNTKLDVHYFEIKSTNEASSIQIPFDLGSRAKFSVWNI